MISVQYACVSNKGKIRMINQDNLICQTVFLPMGSEGLKEPIYDRKRLANERILLGVFDGMGGEQRGEAASYIAAKTAAEWTLSESEKSLEELCMVMNSRICQYADQNKLTTCGTTAAMLLLESEIITGCNLGDSRIYYCRNGMLTQMSEEHVLPVYGGQRKPPLLQFLGIREDEMILEPYRFSRNLQQNDLFLICTDGLTDMLSEEEILRILITREELKTKAECLLYAALSAGGRDNVTLIIVYIDAV